VTHFGLNVGAAFWVVLIMGVHALFDDTNKRRDNFFGFSKHETTRGRDFQHKPIDQFGVAPQEVVAQMEVLHKSIPATQCQIRRRRSCL